MDRAGHPGGGHRSWIVRSGSGRADRRRRRHHDGAHQGTHTALGSTRTDWNILAIIAGSVGLGAIVVNSGLADDISHAILHLSNASTAAVVLAIAVGTTVQTYVVTNAAAAAILTPVGLSVAMTSGLNPVLVLALIGTCISFTFLNPFSHQSNLMVMKPGGYSATMFVRFGIPLTIASVTAAVIVGWALLVP